jgi:glycosyltransferase involved in cell wall biosynthesis
MIMHSGIAPHSRRPGADWGRIAVLAHTHPSVTKGGAEVAAYSLYRGLNALGVDAIFVAACPQAERARLSLGSGNEFAVFHDPAFYEPFYHLSTPELSHSLCGVLAREKVTLANAHHFLNFGVNALRDVAVEANIDTVLTLHEFLLLCHHHGQMVTRPARRLCYSASERDCIACFPEHTQLQFYRRRELFRRYLAPLRGFIAPSAFLAGRIAAAELTDKTPTVIENGVLRRGRDAMASTRRQRAVWTFGFFGQITPFKGVDVLLEAAERLAEMPELAKRVHIRIHGNLVGPDDGFATRFNQALKRHGFLSYAGPYANEGVIGLMRQCEYVLLPSTWWENSPVVIQEAYLAGCPVVCSGIGGMAEKVKDGFTGIHFQVGSASDLVRALEQAADQDTHASLAANLPEVTDHLAMARAYLDAFEEFTGFSAQNQLRRDRDGDELATPGRVGGRPETVRA